MANGQDKSSLHQEALQRLLNGQPRPDVAEARLTAYFDDRSDAATDLIGGILIRMLKDRKVSPEIFPACFTFAARLRRPALRHPLWQVAAGLAEDAISPSDGSPGTGKITELDELLRVYYDAGGDIYVALDELARRRVAAGRMRSEAFLRLLRWTGAFGSDAPAPDASAADVHRWVCTTIKDYCRKAVPGCASLGEFGIAAALRTIAGDATHDLIQAYRRARDCGQPVCLDHLGISYEGSSHAGLPWGGDSKKWEDLTRELFGDSPPTREDRQSPMTCRFQNDEVELVGNAHAQTAVQELLARGRWSEFRLLMDGPPKWSFPTEYLIVPGMYLAAKDGRIGVAAALGQIVLHDHLHRASSSVDLEDSWLMRAVRACCDASFKEEEGPLRAREAAAMERIPNFGDSFFVYDPARHDLTRMPPEIVQDRAALDAKKLHLAVEIMSKVLRQIRELFDQVIDTGGRLELDVL